MPTIALTQPAVEKLKSPAKGRVEYWDKLLPVFFLRISDLGLLISMFSTGCAVI